MPQYTTSYATVYTGHVMNTYWFIGMCRGGEGEGFEQGLIVAMCVQIVEHCGGGEGEGFEQDLIVAMCVQIVEHCGGGEGEGFEQGLIVAMVSCVEMPLGNEI